jgi:hypothetical protein
LDTLSAKKRTHLLCSKICAPSAESVQRSVQAADERTSFWGNQKTPSDLFATTCTRQSSNQWHIKTLRHISQTTAIFGSFNRLAKPLEKLTACGRNGWFCPQQNTTLRFSIDPKLAGDPSLEPASVV